MAMEADHQQNLQLWFAAADVAIERLLKKVGFTVQAIPAKLCGASKRETYMIYVADKPLAAAMETK